MPEVNVKSYNQTLETLRNMVNGVRKYKGDEGFPSVIKEEVLSKIINNLRITRDTYEQTLTKARLLHDEYVNLFNEASTELSRCKTMLYGFYGKKNQIVNDFGIRPFKSKIKKAKPVQSAPVGAPTQTANSEQAA